MEIDREGQHLEAGTGTEHASPPHVQGQRHEEEEAAEVTRDGVVVRGQQREERSRSTAWWKSWRA